jgi:hypothetical protein
MICLKFEKWPFPGRPPGADSGHMVKSYNTDTTNSSSLQARMGKMVCFDMEIISVIFQGEMITAKIGNLTAV